MKIIYKIFHSDIHEANYNSYKKNYEIWLFFHTQCVLNSYGSVAKSLLRECLCKSGPVDFAWDRDLAHFLCVVRNSCTYTKTTIGLIGSLYFSEFYGN